LIGDWQCKSTFAKVFFANLYKAAFSPNFFTAKVFYHMVDKQVCFYRWLVVNPVKSWRTIIDHVRPLRSINRVAWGPILSHCMSAWLMVLSGLLWPSVWPTVHATWSPVSEGIVNPPILPLYPPHPLICGICDTAGCFQKVSQNQLK